MNCRTGFEMDVLVQQAQPLHVAVEPAEHQVASVRGAVQQPGAIRLGATQRFGLTARHLRHRYKTAMCGLPNEGIARCGRGLRDGTGREPFQSLRDPCLHRFQSAFYGLFHQLTP